MVVIDSLNRAQALRSVKKHWAQFSKWTYIRGDEIIVRDDEENIVAVYQITPPAPKAKQKRFKFKP